MRDIISNVVPSRVLFHVSLAFRVFLGFFFFIILRPVFTGSIDVGPVDLASSGRRNFILMS